MVKQRFKRHKRDLVMPVIRGAREYSNGTVHFHQAVGQLLGVNITDMRCLDVMALQGAVSPSQLAQHTGLSTGATTAMIDRLEKAGLVERHPHPRDRRRTTLVLSKAGSRRLPALFQSLAKALEALISSYFATCSPTRIAPTPRPRALYCIIACSM